MERVSLYWIVLTLTLGLTCFVLLIKRFLNVSKKRLENIKVSKKLGTKRLSGPINVPILGSVLHILVAIRRIPLFSTPMAVIRRVTNVWGNLVGIEIGTTKIVIINDIHVARKLMCCEEWSDRIDDNPLWTGNQHLGLLFSNRESWKEIRRYALKSLGKFGFNKSNSLQTLHEEEIQNFVTYLDKQIEIGNGMVELHGMFDIPALNILWSMVANSRFSYEDKEIKSIMNCLEQFGQAFKISYSAVLLFPWLRFIPFATGYFKTKNSCLRMQNYFQKLVEEKRVSGVYKTEQTNFIDSTLEEIDRHKEQNIQPNYYTDEQLVRVLVDFFITGFAPTSSSLEFLLLYLILNPKIQERCRAEIDSVIGIDRQPKIEDREKMPYVQAVYLEVLRTVSILPITSRTNTRDTFIEGHFVPKNTLAAINIYGMHHDPKFWEDPDEFRPERFLDSDGNIINQEGILPFGTDHAFYPPTERNCTKCTKCKKCKKLKSINN